MRAIGIKGSANRRAVPILKGLKDEEPMHGD
jgi:hypothetical protein